MNSQDKNGQLYNNNYPLWLEYYEKDIKSSVESTASAIAPKINDPMADYKARAELALLDW
jgi:PhoPQ-activated pathogenicity-related protein